MAETKIIQRGAIRADMTPEATPGTGRVVRWGLPDAPADGAADKRRKPTYEHKMLEVAPAAIDVVPAPEPTAEEAPIEVAPEFTGRRRG